MNRLLKCIIGDIFLQYKYGIYLIYSVITILYIIILNQIPDHLTNTIIPFILLTDPSLLGIFFIGGLVLFEKGEGTLEYLVVSPLSIKEYLLSKMISLTIISVIASGTIVVFSYKHNLNKITLILGIVLTSLLFVLIGFIAVVRFNTVNKYLLASIIYMTVLFSPFIDYFGLYKSWVFYLIPTKASIILIFGAFEKIEIWEGLYSILYLI